MQTLESMCALIGQPRLHKSIIDRSLIEEDTNEKSMNIFLLVIDSTNNKKHGTFVEYI